MSGVCRGQGTKIFEHLKRIALNNQKGERCEVDGRNVVEESMAKYWMAEELERYG